MLKQYSVLSKCLTELKKSDLPIIEKLRLEVQMIQTKRILLDHQVEHRVTGLSSSEKQFNDLFDRVRYVCNSGTNATEVDRLKGLIQEIKAGLDSEANGRNLFTLLSSDKKGQSPVGSLLHGVKDIFS